MTRNDIVKLAISEISKATTIKKWDDFNVVKNSENKTHIKSILHESGCFKYVEHSYYLSDKGHKVKDIYNGDIDLFDNPPPNKPKDSKLDLISKAVAIIGIISTVFFGIRSCNNDNELRDCESQLNECESDTDNKNRLIEIPIESVSIHDNSICDTIDTLKIAP